MLITVIILGIVQGLAEFLPISSSGHLALIGHLFDLNGHDNLYLTVVLHLATVLSIVIVFYKDIYKLLKGIYKGEKKDFLYSGKIIISSLPIAFIGLLFKDDIESLFDNKTWFVGLMLILTAILLYFTKSRGEGKKEITFLTAFIMGLAQLIAILPGISRSGITIAIALFCGIKRNEASKFSFLMLLPPVFGIFLFSMFDIINGSSVISIGWYLILISFSISLIIGVFACKFMIKLVNKGNLIYFSVYCLLLGMFSILFL